MVFLIKFTQIKEINLELSVADRLVIDVPINYFDVMQKNAIIYFQVEIIVV